MTTPPSSRRRCGVLHTPPPATHAPHPPSAPNDRSLRGELVVGGVFVRVYNARPLELPPDPPAFCKVLVR